MAAEGAKLDKRGMKFSGDKGRKEFFNKRRALIERVNEKMGFLGEDFDSDEDGFKEIGGGK